MAETNTVYAGPIAGMKFHPGRHEVELGDELVLVADLGNKYDSRAIKVLTKSGTQVGWIPRDRTTTLYVLVVPLDKLNATYGPKPGEITVTL